MQGSVRALREAKLRKALLGTTALIGFALASPAMAQNTYTASDPGTLDLAIFSANSNQNSTIFVSSDLTSGNPRAITADTNIQSLPGNTFTITGSLNLQTTNPLLPARLNIRDLYLDGGSRAAVNVTQGGFVNNLSGTLSGNWGVYNNTGGMTSVFNDGTIYGVDDGVSVHAGQLDLVNSGTITAVTYAGVFLGGDSAGPQSITNNVGGVIQGGNDGTNGYAINNSSTGPLTLNNWGTINAGAGAVAIHLGSSNTQTVNLKAGSTVNGEIVASNNGTRAVTIEGTLSGVYDAASRSNSGVDNVTLAATGSISGVSLGGGDDAFIWQGGAFDIIDGGTGTDSFTVDLTEHGSGSLSLSNLSNFESYTHQSGALTLTGNSTSAYGWQVTGGSITLAGGLGTIGSENTITLRDGTTATINTTGELVAENGHAIYGATGTATIVNDGLIGTGVLFPGGSYLPGGSTSAIRGNNLVVTNNANGWINGASGGIFTDGTLKLVNRGTIQGNGAGTSNYDAVFALGEANIINAGTISQATYAAIYTGGGGTITNAVAGVLSGGNGGIGGTGVALYGGGTFNNYGTAHSISGNGVVIVGAGARVNLFAGSNTGNITGGAGNDTLAIYTGADMGADIVDNVTGITLQNGNASDAAIYGAIDLGGGTDTIELRGTRTAGFLLTRTTGVEVLTKLDAGTWSLTGAAATPGIRINAGDGSAAGTLTFANTTGLTGDIYVNGATVRAASSGALGTGTVHMVKPIVEFVGGANSTHSNNFALETASTDQSIFRVGSGFNIALTGNITTGAGLNTNGAAIAPYQAVTFQSMTAGGGFTLSGFNDWSGTTTIDKAIVTANGGAAIGDGSTVNFVNGGSLVLGANETVGNLSGTGNVSIGANTLTLGGNNASTTFDGVIDDVALRYVGSWAVSDGPSRSPVPPVYSGVEAAALIFGGNAADYRISTNGNSTATINDSAWMVGWGDPNTYGNTPAADDLHLDAGAAGYQGTGDYSAYVLDHSGVFRNKINYAFANGPAGGGLVKTGTGTLTLTGASTYTGTTTISGGTLALSGAGSLASSPIVNNAALDLSDHTGDVTLLNLTGTGTTNLGANTLTVDKASGTYSGNLTGNGGVIKRGGNLWTLTGTNSWSGITYLLGGGLAGTTSSISGSSITSSAWLAFDQAFDGSYAGNITNNPAATVNITGTGLVTLAGNIIGGTINVTGAGSKLLLSGDASSSGVDVSGAGASLTVDTDISGGAYNGVRLEGAGASLTNNGWVNGSSNGANSRGAAVLVTAASGTNVITNRAEGKEFVGLYGEETAINHVGAGALTVNNHAWIGGQYGIRNQDGAGSLIVNNKAGGWIVGERDDGINLDAFTIGAVENGTLTLDNAGIVVGEGSGIASNLLVNVTNSGIIASGGVVYDDDDNPVSVDFGTGLAMQIAGGTVTNLEGGVIRGGVGGIRALSDLTLSNAGTIIGDAGPAIIAEGNLIVTANSGTITGADGASAINASRNITLRDYAGTTTGDSSGVFALGTLTATITGGTITGTNQFALFTRGNDSVITNGGTLIGGTAGIYANADNLTVINNGTIRATGVETNGNARAAPNGYDGIYAGGAGASVTNNGLIESTSASGRGVYLAGGGTVTNNSGGTIRGGSLGINIAGGLVTNQANALITGAEQGIYAYDAEGGNTTINNSGTIVSTGIGSRGIQDGGSAITVTNQLGGTIVGNSWGIQVGAAGAITNSGFIGSGTLANGTSGAFTASASGSGITIWGGSVTNNAGATIHGGAIGVLSNGAATIVNNGTIIGGTAILLIGNFADTVTLGADSATIGAIELGDGNDVLNWNGGSFTSIYGGAGTDVFNADLTGSATLDMGTITNFEMHNLRGGDLTLTGSSHLGDGSWAVAGGTLTFGANAQVNATGTGLNFTGTGTLNVTQGSSLIGNGGNGVLTRADFSAAIDNAGLIRSTGSNFNGVNVRGGGTVTNQATGLIVAEGNGVILQTASANVNNAGMIVGKVNGVVGNDAAQTLVNSGVIVTGSATDATTELSQVVRDGTGSGVVFTAGGTVTNTSTGYIGGNVNGVSISGATANVTNGGTIAGGSTGVAVALDADVSGSLINQQGGTLDGGVKLGGAGAISVTLANGSTTNGDIVSTGSGTRTVDISGTLGGSYDASNGSGSDNVTLHAGGSIVSANLGDGDDTFTYLGGSITGMVDGGAGRDSLFADFGAGTSNSVTLANFVNFEVFGVLSGNLQLTGPSNTPGADIYAGNGAGTGGTITFDGTTNLTGDIYVNGGDIVANTEGAFGTGTIHLIDPKATFAATGVFSNNISLEVVTPSTADPSTLATTSGVVATLTGAITQGSGGGIDPRQELVIDGQGTIVLTNTSNSWAGTTTINAGATLQGTSQTISGSNIVANGTLAYVQSASGTVAKDISGAGQVTVSGLATGQSLVLSGNVTTAGGIAVLDRSTLINIGTINASGGTAVNLTMGGSFQSNGRVTGAIVTTGNANISLLENSTTVGAIQASGSGETSINIAGRYTGAVTLGSGNDSIRLEDTAWLGAGTTLNGGSGFDMLFLAGSGNGQFDTGMATGFETYQKTGTGTWTLTGADASTANWVINQGTLVISGSAVNDASLVSISAGATLQLRGSEGIGNLAGNGNVALGGYSLVLNAGNSSFSGTITGTGGLYIARGAGITLSGANSYTGVTAVEGTLTLGASDVLGDGGLVVVAAGGTLDLGANSDTVRYAVIDGTLNGTGTLTASQYSLEGATVNANLGAGTLYNMGGTSVLNGTAAGDVSVQTGTLALGAADRLADGATVAVAAGATLDLGAFNDTVGALGLNGTLAGTGTLTASEYQLNGATVNANLGTGTVFNLAGTSVLNGTAAGNASVQAGTLTLGAADRLADTAIVAVATGATFDIGAFNDTIGTLSLNGTLAGTGTLTATEYQLTGATVNANLGTGTIFNLAGTSVLNGTAAANASVQGGTLALGAADRLANTATVAVAAGATFDIGGFNDTIGVLALNGTLAGTGTLTATEYQLTGATVNANLGTGTIFNLAGTSVLNGTAAANASVQAGTLVLGAADRFANTATVAVAAGATFDIGGFNDTIGTLSLNGTLAGTGTLTATAYQLTSGTVNANLGTGTVFNLAGTSVLNGTSAGNVSVQAGTLRLGAGDRLADAARVDIAKDASFDLAGYNETLGGIAGAGTLVLGASKLTLAGTATSSFSGSITGNGTIEKLGAGTQILSGNFAHSGSIDVAAGTLAFGGSTQGSIRLQGGTLIGGGTITGPLTIASGTFSPGGLSVDQAPASPIGSFTVSSLVATGGTLLVDFGGTSFNFGADSIKVTGTATLTGGTVQVNALSARASEYRYNQLYTIVEANSLTGTFANGSDFATVASNPNLRWRLRYDLVPNSVVLQVQKRLEFTEGVSPNDVNTFAVASALTSATTGSASDQWAATLNAFTETFADVQPQQRFPSFRSLSGEVLANVSTANISANNQFTDLLRQRVGDGSDALIGGGFTGSSLADVRTTTTSGSGFVNSLAGASLPGVDAGSSEEASNGGIWGQVYGGYQKLIGDGVRAGLDNTVAGVAMGIETKLDGFTAGIAGGIAQIDSNMDSRNSTVSGNQYQLGGYLSYDAGSAFIAASGSWYSSELDSKRTLSIGTTTSMATGDIHATGYSVGVNGGFRTELGKGLRLALIGSANKIRNQQDGFTESATGGLGLAVAKANRDLFTAGAELRLGAKVKTGAGVAMPWVSMGVRYNSGDRDTLGAVRFSGAPSGTGAFTVEGVKIAPVLGTLGVGIDARASKNVRLGIALEGSAGENTREGRASVRVKIGF